MTIGDRLDKAMRDAKIPSQSALHRASGVPQATISRILKKTGAKGPESETLRRLAEACNVSFEWLNEGVGHQTRSKVVTDVQHGVKVDPHEILELISGYSAANATERKGILNLARSAARNAIQRNVIANHNK